MSKRTKKKKLFNYSDKKPFFESCVQNIILSSESIFFHTSIKVTSFYLGLHQTCWIPENCFKDIVTSYFMSYLTIRYYQRYFFYCFLNTENIKDIFHKFILLKIWRCQENSWTWFKSKSKDLRQNSKLIFLIIFSVNRIHMIRMVFVPIMIKQKLIIAWKYLWFLYQ